MSYLSSQWCSWHEKIFTILLWGVYFHVSTLRCRDKHLFLHLVTRVVGLRPVTHFIPLALHHFLCKLSPAVHHIPSPRPFPASICFPSGHLSSRLALINYSPLLSLLCCHELAFHKFPQWVNWVKRVASFNQSVRRTVSESERVRACVRVCVRVRVLACMRVCVSQIVLHKRGTF